MTLPQGTGWQVLRSRCFTTLSQHARADFRNPMPLWQWIETGDYSATITGTNKAELITPNESIEAALLADIELLLDHALEQEAHLEVSASQNCWLSPAWNLVTTYYWAFFAAQATTRLLGNFSWFLDDHAVDLIVGVSSGGTLRSGAYVCEKQTLTGSATHCLLRLSKSKDKIHTSVWNRLAQQLTIASGVSSEESSQLEFRLLRALAKISGRLSPSWPSLLRDAVNYRPGIGYREVRGNQPMRFKLNRSLGIENAIDYLETCAESLAVPSDLNADLSMSAQGLLSFAGVLSALAWDLHEAAVSRDRTDIRWRWRRTAFRTQHKLNAVVAQ